MPVQHVSHRCPAPQTDQDQRMVMMQRSVSFTHSWTLQSHLVAPNSYSPTACLLPGTSDYRDITWPLSKKSCAMPTHSQAVWAWDKFSMPGVWQE